MAKVKVNITLDEELLQRIESFADENYLTRSGLITLATSQYLTQAEASRAIVDLSLAMRKIAETGTITEDQLEELENFERFARMLSGK